MSRYDIDCQEISAIIKAGFDKYETNRRIKIIELRMEIEEQKELDGKGTGYYQ